MIDPATRTLYVADAFGRLHAFDLATGTEHAGWPVVLYRDYRRELVWGAMLLVDGAIYAGTGAYCDLPMEGKLIRVSLADRKVSSWTVVPPELGGGGGIWGWGGVAYSPRRDSLYVVTGNAFEGGTNKGAAFSEAAGYGEHLVERSPDLSVRSSDAPALTGFTDLDFVGSPVVADPSGCDELVLAQAKNGMFFAWKAGDVSSGPAWSLKLQKADPGTPLLTQPTWSPRFRSFYVATASKLVRIRLDSACKPRWPGRRRSVTRPSIPRRRSRAARSGSACRSRTSPAWPRRSSVSMPHRPGAGAVPDPGRLVRAADGRRRDALPRLDARARRRRLPRRPRRARVGLQAYGSALDAAHRWQSREDGVWSTDDGGRHWRRIYPRYATRVLRMSRTTGLISVGSPAPACGCATRQLWTQNGGKTWRSAVIGQSYTASGGAVYWWTDNGLFLAAPNLRSSTRIALTDDTIVSGTPVAGGMAALVDRRDKAPQVILAQGTSTRWSRSRPAPRTPSCARSVAPAATSSCAAHPSRRRARIRLASSGHRRTVAKPGARPRRIGR